MSTYEGERIVDAVNRVIRQFQGIKAHARIIEMTEADHNALRLLASASAPDALKGQKGECSEVQGLPVIHGRFRRTRVCGHYTNPLIDRVALDIRSQEPV